jgi:hypothetical protein
MGQGPQMGEGEDYTYFIIIIYLTANGFSPGGRGTTIRQQTNNTQDNRQ